MRTRLMTYAMGTAVAVTLALPPLARADGTARPAADPTAGALAVVGLTTDQRLVEFRTDGPARPTDLGRVTGLSGDGKIVGIDFRVQDRKLYGIGDRGGIYVLDRASAQAEKASQLTVPLAGTAFGVDFNPAANRLRVVSDTGQNLRHNIDDPAAPETTTVDGTLTNPAPPPGTAQPTTARGVTGAAYTNNDLVSATATTLFDLDTGKERLSLQSPANSGTLAPTGNLGAAAGPSAGFDIYHSPEAKTNHGFATLQTPTAYGFHTVDLLTGTTTAAGAFPAGTQVFDIALPLEQG
ncbi:DUF4394 domain-containing protein [Streptomyces antarcticus]|uniref:DUF4394 domain-containing protein n=1 Tax=Streptomyces antarcticus TaxID=2996458 RepID=UPI00226F1727|nr:MULTISPECIES: DUF4394 domain-containing protein [unclassified Streptomyces]MCY0945496.1 DUF4394 domain-containing protein [Streptomyces sp. H34-AA3]MCZ4083617.1 DUF4394 domain-containing protein [Streptomyces sp. H34-S5]